jgi:NADH dehydrogenase (ubiquinone) 1 alpha subcomplex subunit 6
MEEARGRTLALYREFLREIPRMVAIYPLDLPISTLRASMRRKFNAAKNETSLPIINRLLIKGKLWHKMV